jgi:glycosyltransferase involved in cell wall biosynthesis
LKTLNLDLFINVSHGSVLPCPAARGVFICMFPHRFNQKRVDDAFRSRMRRRLVDEIESTLAGANERTWLDSYTRVIAISRFAADWVKRLWHRESHVIYPPVDEMGSAAKAQMILNVGRFTRASANSHHKAQDVLLAAFTKMTQSHRNGWELHFAGNVDSDSGGTQFADALAQRAEGLPVRFHFNAKFEELRDLYQQAAIYWHATGAGTDALEHPELQEHFGITTVEAMSAGAVPIVIASGGQTEIVTHGVDGMCWNDIDEMLVQTELLMSDIERRERLRKNALDSSRRFNRAAFTANMDLSIAEILS